MPPSSPHAGRRHALRTPLRRTPPEAARAAQAGWRAFAAAGLGLPEIPPPP